MRMSLICGFGCCTGGGFGGSALPLAFASTAAAIAVPGLMRSGIGAVRAATYFFSVALKKLSSKGGNSAWIFSGTNTME